MKFMKKKTVNERSIFMSKIPLLIQKPIFLNNFASPNYANYVENQGLKGVLHPWALSLKALCIFSKK